MKIRTRLQVGMAFLLTQIVIIPLIFNFALTENYALEARRDLTREIFREVNELQFITFDYLMHRERRAFSQWQLKRESLTRLLIAELSSTADDRAFLARLRGNIMDMNVIFLRLAALGRDGKIRHPSTLREEAESMLISQLLIRTHTIVTETNRFQEETRDHAVADQRRTMYIVVGVVGLLTLITASILVFVNRIIMEAVERLEAGAKAFAEGNLDHRVTAVRDDELGNLGGALNLMAGKLGHSYARLGEEVEERRRAEEEVRTLNRELESHLDQLEAANREMESFCYTVSHDLRAPLRHINGFVELLQGREQENLGQKSRHYLDEIGGAALRMGMLVDGLLDFSRMARAEMPTTRVDLDSLVRETVNVQMRYTVGRDICWEIARLPEVEGNPDMLRLVFANLIANAIKFTRKRPEAQIEIGSILNSENDAVVFVRDNGSGFDMKYANKLFGLFQRLHHQDEFEGTGVGLAIVRRIVGRHGGRIWAESEPDRGATFYVSLPIPSPDKTG